MAIGNRSGKSGVGERSHGEQAFIASLPSSLPGSQDEAGGPNSGIFFGGTKPRCAIESTGYLFGEAKTKPILAHRSSTSRLLGRTKAISPASAKPHTFESAGSALPLLTLWLRSGIQLLSSPPWLTRTSSMRVAPRTLLSATTLSLSLCLSSNTLLPSESLAVNFVTSLPSRPR